MKSPVSWNQLGKYCVDGIVCLNAISMGLAMELKVHSTMWRQLDCIFASCFLLEMLACFASKRGAFFNDPWRILDFMLTILGAIDVFLFRTLRIDLPLFFLTALRLLRPMLTWAHPVNRGPGQYRLAAAEGLHGAVVALMWIVPALTTILYTACLSLMAVSSNDRDSMVHDPESLFGTLPKTMHVLLEACVLNQWATIKPFVANHPAILACFAFLFLLATVIVLSLVASAVLHRTLQMHEQFVRATDGSDCTGKVFELADVLFAHTHALSWEQLQAELQRGDASVRRVLPELSMTELKLHLGSVKDGHIYKEDLIAALRLMVPEKLEHKIAELRQDLQDGLCQIQQELRQSMSDPTFHATADGSRFSTPKRSSASHRPGLLLMSPVMPVSSQSTKSLLAQTTGCEVSNPSSPQGSPQGHQAHQAIVNLGSRIDDSLRRLEVMVLAELATIKAPTSPKYDGDKLKSPRDSSQSGDAHDAFHRETTCTTAGSGLSTSQLMQSFEKRLDEMARQTEVMVSAELASRHSCLEQRLMELLSTSSMNQSGSSCHTNALRDGPERVRILVLSSDHDGHADPKDIGECTSRSFEGVLRDSGLETSEKDEPWSPWRLPMPSFEETPVEEEEAPLVPRWTAATAQHEAATAPGSSATMRHNVGTHPEPIESWQALALEEIAWQETPRTASYCEVVHA